MIFGARNDEIGGALWYQQSDGRQGYVGTSLFNQWGMTSLNPGFLRKGNSRWPLTPATGDIPKAAIEWFAQCVYRDVDRYSDSEILLMSPRAVVELYYSQLSFQIIDGSCDSDWKNCPEYIPSPYTRQMIDAVRRYKKYFPFPSSAGQTSGPSQFLCEKGCRGYRPSKPSDCSDYRNLAGVGLALADRIYRLRPDLHQIVNPETGEPMPGLQPFPAIPNCERRTSTAHIIADSIKSIFTALIPGAGWITLAADVYLAVDEYQAMMRQMNRMGQLMSNIPKGIQAILETKLMHGRLLSVEEAELIPINAESDRLARMIGLPHPAMICGTSEDCSPENQVRLLAELIDHWNVNRLIARRAEYERWRRVIIKRMTPDCEDPNGWSNVLFRTECRNSEFYGKGDSRTTACENALPGYEDWKAEIEATILAGPVPPRPHTPGDDFANPLLEGQIFPNFPGFKTFDWRKAYPRDILSRVDDILNETNWFDPNNTVSENLMQYVDPPIDPSVINPNMTRDPVPDGTPGGFLSELVPVTPPEEVQGRDLTAEAGRASLELEADEAKKSVVPIAIGLSLLLL